MDRTELFEAVKDRLMREPHYSFLDSAQHTFIASRLIGCQGDLLPNLVEWLNNKPLTDIWINDKYCIGAIMKIRKSDDFVPCFIALDDYAKDPGAEFAIWQRWS